MNALLHPNNINATQASNPTTALNGVFAMPFPCKDNIVSADSAWPMRHRRLVSAIAQRRGGPAQRNEVDHSRLAIEQAAERYFMLLDHAAAGLRGRFDEAEFTVMLNAVCSPVCEWDPWLTMAGMVADDNGVETREEMRAGLPLRELIEKLTRLSPVENAVLVDACERVYRGHDNPLL